MLCESKTGLKACDRIVQPAISALYRKVECFTYVDSKFSEFRSTIKIDYEDGLQDSIHKNHPLAEPAHPFKHYEFDAKRFSLVVPIL